MMDKKVCPICEEGVLTVREDVNESEYKGVKAAVPFVYQECDACGSQQADASLSLKNKRLMMAFRKKVDGVLTGEEVRSVRERLKLKQSEAALVFGGGPTAFSKYESDDIAQSVAMDKLLRTADALPEVFRYLCKLAGQEVPQGAPILSVVEGDDNVIWRPVDFPDLPAGVSGEHSSSESHVISGEEGYG